ncbi:MAG: cytochrome c oxidase cbb3-type subunit 3 [Planctomycetota bacterium]|jgi:cytochrome c oxidase cbb3-type subunit 3
MTAELRSHTFDGIQEFDNRLPNWWLWSFYLACIFSVFYWIHYQTLGTGNQPMDDYFDEQRVAAAAMEERLKKNPVTNEVLLELASNPTFVAEGRALFLEPLLCMQCHKANASGDVGPNLTDEFWIYGGTPMDIYTTIMDGRPGGMQAYKSRGLGFVQRVAAYVLSLKNTNVPGKPPGKNAKKAQ